MKQGVESSNGERNSLKELLSGILSMLVLRHLLGQEAVCLSREVRTPYSVLTSLGEVGLDSQPLEASSPCGADSFLAPLRKQARLTVSVEENSQSSDNAEPHVFLGGPDLPSSSLLLTGRFVP